MNKKELLKYFSEDEIDEVLNLYNKYELALKKDITVFGSDFYSPNIWKFFEDKVNDKGIIINTDGLFSEAERRMISFNNYYNEKYPYKIIKIENTSKFNKLNHRDYLGAVLALGIKRNKIGDMLVKEDCCYFPICNDIWEYVLYNLTSVGRVKCKVELIDNYNNIPKYDFKEEVILVQSLRIDSIVSKITRLSRGKAQSLIDEGKVFVNYNKTRDKSLEVSENSRVTVRGFGKFIVCQMVGSSKSGKIKILIKKYS